MKPDPLALIEVPIEPRDEHGYAALLAALKDLPQTVVTKADAASGRIILAGPDEQKLDHAIGLLRTRPGVAFHIGAPAIAYRETVLREALADHTHKTGGETPSFARVKLSVEPHDGGGFVRAIEAGALPEAFVAAVEAAAAETLGAGPSAGFPVVDVRVVLRNGAFHATDSSPEAFRLAGLRAVREALAAADAVLLEPLMMITVATPADCAGAVEADLRSRRARDFSMRANGDAVVIEAVVPLANAFGYPNALRGISLERASHALAFARYEIVGGPDDDRFPPATAARA